MYKLTVVTDPEVADGFRLSGVDVRVAFSPEEARQIVSELMDDPEIGIIGLDVRLESGIDLRLQRKIDSVYRPVVVTLPLGDRGCPYDNACPLPRAGCNAEPCIYSVSVHTNED